MISLDPSSVLAKFRCTHSSRRPGVKYKRDGGKKKKHPTTKYSLEEERLSCEVNGGEGLSCSTTPGRPSAAFRLNAQGAFAV